MCNFFSALIIDKNKKCLWDSCIDSHSELVAKFKLDDTTTSPKFVRVELTPPHYTVDAFKNPESWNFKTDQDLLPDWYDKNIAKNTTIEAVKEFIKDHVFFDGSHEIKEGRAIFLGSSRAVLRGSSSAVLWESSSAELSDHSVSINHKKNEVCVPENYKVVTHK